MKIIKTNDLLEIKTLAQEIFESLKNKKFLLLNGDLGAGKTTLVKEIAKLLEIQEKITSPSFNYMKMYDDKLIHIDMYNYKGDLDEFEAYFDDVKVVAIEWANKCRYDFDQYISVDIEVDQNLKHIYTIKGIE
ncbi:tRNA (adenosine(37)-N6)-threonylcarbamoyltransferase complex ATPase subunit type 1 TsaE [Mycoplasmopsis ciconiae]|uniref:tRNA threonylcarbamoyladenosine biosynthesis protein TsaE n=1 Tax=Mycoplasmopsis ciconiae TaxID=561067 RepID=A0ABU7MLW4_9BACT|nr:tRNA (adenosine(37)-N6)-threonylcarbamoyltransferase complex ATPase subunit type 1 TsaE [Mycoplasmopsis ciconiae]